MPMVSSQTAFDSLCNRSRNMVNKNAVFETSIAVIRRINDRTRFVAHAERGEPRVADDNAHEEYIGLIDREIARQQETEA